MPRPPWQPSACFKWSRIGWRDCKIDARLFLNLADDSGLNTGNSKDAPVIPIILGDSLRCIRVASALHDQGVDVQPILYPAVPESQSRLRFFITAEHTEEQICRTVQLLTDCLVCAAAIVKLLDRLPMISTQLFANIGKVVARSVSERRPDEIRVEG